MSADAATKSLLADLKRRVLDLERLLKPHVTAANFTAALQAEAQVRANVDTALDGRLDDAETQLATYPDDFADVLADAAPPAVGASGVVGVSTQAAREDHTHATPFSNTVANNVSAVAGSAGFANTAARGDHQHQVSVGTPGAAAVGAAAAAGSQASLARSDHAHSFATGTPAAVTPDGVASAGSGGAFVHSNHQHGLATYASTPVAVSANTGSAGTSGTAPARGNHQHALTPANGSTPGGVDLSAQKLGAGEKSADSFKGTGANTVATIASAVQVLRAESTAASGQAVLDFFVNASRRGLIRADSFGNIVTDAVTSVYTLVGGATKILAAAARTDITQESWATPTLLGQWRNFTVTADQQVARYRKDSFGEVELNGFIETNAAVANGTTIMTLPSGFRPATKWVQGVVYGLSSWDVLRPGRLEIDTAGNVVFWFDTAVVGTPVDFYWVSLNGVRFPT